MAKAVKTKNSKTNPKGKVRRTPFRWLLWQGFRVLCAGFVLVIGLILLFTFVNPPTTIYMSQESHRLGGVDHEWVSIEEISPVMARSVVAAEDANFCQHWGFDLKAIKVADKRVRELRDRWDFRCLQQLLGHRCQVRLH